jgi:hypothetical protein
MSYTIVGLFPSQNQSKDVSKSLENKGFKDSDYIIYINDNKPVEKKSFWSKIFTHEIDEEVTIVDSLIISVAINNNAELEKAKEAFAENNVINTYPLDDVSFEEAKNLDYIKKVVALKAKMLIYAMPEVKTSTSEMHTGINADVNIGK